MTTTSAENRWTASRSKASTERTRRQGQRGAVFTAQQVQETAAHGRNAEMAPACYPF
ncbi:MAG: hypothetical protein GY740_24435 [Gammaproteobacteria bacterium]|nr:hypothetical protein [Gammaproteobacteria bacterium]